MDLKEFFDYKNQLADDLLTNEKIVRLINSDISLEDAGQLMYTQVFPYEYIPDTVEHGRTFVCADVDVSKPVNKSYLSLTLFIWVFTHKSLLRLPEGGVRTDALCSEICDEINGSLMYGMGGLDFYSSKRFAPMTDYQGKCLIFHAEDLSKTYDPYKRIPSNRKRGQ